MGCSWWIFQTTEQEVLGTCCLQRYTKSPNSHSAPPVPSLLKSSPWLRSPLRRRTARESSWSEMFSANWQVLCIAGNQKEASQSLVVCFCLECKASAVPVHRRLKMDLLVDFPSIEPLLCSVCTQCCVTPLPIVCQDWTCVGCARRQTLQGLSLEVLHSPRSRRRRQRRSQRSRRRLTDTPACPHCVMRKRSCW